MKTVTFSHPYGQKGFFFFFNGVWFICRPAGKALLPAHSLPCPFRHELLANTPCQWQPWHPELLRVRGRTGTGADRPCLEGPERSRGTQEGTERASSDRAAQRPLRILRRPPVLGWRASATVCPAAAMAPSPGSGSLSLLSPPAPAQGTAGVGARLGFQAQRGPEAHRGHGL